MQTGENMDISQPNTEHECDHSDHHDSDAEVEILENSQPTGDAANFLSPPDAALDPPPSKRLRLSPAPIPIPSQSAVRLSSIHSLLSELTLSSDPRFSEILRSHSLVGFLNPTLGLLQFKTKLYLADLQRISNLFIYQLILTNFSNFPVMKISPPIELSAVLACLEEYSVDSARIEEAKSCLCDKAELLKDYYSIVVDPEAGTLVGLPEILGPLYLPPLIKLPEFLFSLATRPDWNREKHCLNEIAHRIADFYEIQSSDLYLNPKCELSWWVQHQFLPSLKLKRSGDDADYSWIRIPSNFGSDGGLTEIASLENLYKVFERC